MVEHALHLPGAGYALHSHPNPVMLMPSPEHTANDRVADTVLMHAAVFVTGATAVLDAHLDETTRQPNRAGRP